MVWQIKIIVNLCASAVVIWTALRQAYWWQVKEYRWDRMWSWLRHNSGWKEMVRLDIRKPTFTQRGQRLVFTGTIFGLIPVLLSNSWLGIIVAPLLAAVGVIVGIIWTRATVERTTKKESKLAHDLIEKLHPKVIAITGSFGKSSSKDLVAEALAAKYQVVKTQGSENTVLGIARRILSDVKPSTQIVVVEMGAYTRGELAKICEMVRPDIAWVTAIGNQHLDLFGGLENLKKAKFEIVEALKPGGLAVFNEAAGEKDLIKWAKNLGIKTLVYSAPGREGNVVGAKAIAKFLGVSRVKLTLSEPKIIETPGGIRVVDSSHNTNQQAFEANIEYLKNHFSGRKFVVSPGIIELGRETYAVHQKLRQLMQDLNGYWLGNYDHIMETLKPGDTILIEGRIPSSVKTKILKL